jgi:hypothetical protein
MNSVDRLHLGMTREEVIAVLGPPDDRGGTFRKYKTPSIFKYGQIEVYFEPWKTGRLTKVFIGDQEGNGSVLLQ